MMCVFQSFVRNKSRPEGSIAESYIARECSTLCARYLNMTETCFNRPERNDDIDNKQLHSLSVFSSKGKPLGKANVEQLSFDEWKTARLYVLKNCEEAQPFLE